MTYSRVGKQGCHLLFNQNIRKMTNEERIKKWLAGELSDTEKKEFEGTEEFARISKLLAAVQHFKAPSYDAEAEYNRLTESRNRSQNTRDRKKTITLDDRLRQLFRAAAILVLALTAGYFLYQQVFSSAGSGDWITEQTELYLPDSSYVTLNTASSIRYAEKNWDKERVVELKGEAFFNVRAGDQFTVKTQQGEITVLGTEFNVKDWGDYFHVTCYSGSVRVSTAQRSIVLQPQSSYRMINGKEENFIYSGEATPDWLRGESSFRSVPLSVVLEELERQYHVIVETRNVDVNQLFTGSFSHKNLEIALESITIPVNLHYEIDENKSVITVEGK